VVVFEKNGRVEANPRKLRVLRIQHEASFARNQQEGMRRDAIRDLNASERLVMRQTDEMNQAFENT
jgi:hypothetical protein